MKIDSIWLNFTEASASVRLILATAVNSLRAALSLLLFYYYYFLILLKLIHSVFLVLFSLSNENRFDYTCWHYSFCRY